MLSKRSKNLPTGTLAIALLFLLVILSTYLLIRPSPPPDELRGVISQQFRVIYDFDLVSGKGNSITQKDLQDKWSFIFFGYTSCPDICPATLHILSQVKQLLVDEDSQKTENVQVLFISVDPKRDNPEKINDYVGYFDKTFIAATGGETELLAFSRQLDAGYIIEPETAPDTYNVIHTSAIFLIDPLLRRVATFSQPHYAATISQQFEKIRAYFSGIS
ncbi:MAG: SCO family protein [Gammaproteobacteria bacterium]|nr:SCO family protein [Gammaproteobacteria bacterium]